MSFFEEADLVDMMSDTGIDVTWGAVSRKGLYRRQTESFGDGVVNPQREEVPSVLVELTYFRDVKEGDAITVDTPDGTSWKVRQIQVEMRSLLRLYLAVA